MSDWRKRCNESALSNNAKDTGGLLGPKWTPEEL